MKAIFYSLAVAAVSFFISASASAQYHRDHDDHYQRAYDDQCRDNRQQSFYYYPQSNVYYSFTTDKYIFFSHNAWVVSDRLPHYYRLKREPRFVVSHAGFDVWNENRYHVMKYSDHRRSQPDVAYDRRDRNDVYNYPERDNNWKR